MLALSGLKDRTVPESTESPQREPMTSHLADARSHLHQRRIEVNLTLHTKPCVRNQRRHHAAAQLAGLGGALIQRQLVRLQELDDARVCLVRRVIYELHDACVREEEKEGGGNKVEPTEEAAA